MPNILEATKERVLLGGITWEAYECLLENAEQTSGSRLTYDHGRLEIMSPYSRHERRNRQLAHIVEILAEAWDLEMRELVR